MNKEETFLLVVIVTQVVLLGTSSTSLGAKEKMRSSLMISIQGQSYKKNLSSFVIGNKFIVKLQRSNSSFLRDPCLEQVIPVVSTWRGTWLLLEEKLKFLTMNLNWWSKKRKIGKILRSNRSFKLLKARLCRARPRINWVAMMRSKSESIQKHLYNFFIYSFIGRR